MRPLLLSAVLTLSAPGQAVQPSAAPTDRAPAMIRVTLPADAKLTFDGQATESTSGNRLFTSPPLEMGKSFRYSVKAEFVRAGKTIIVQQDITVRAGCETLVSLLVPVEAPAPSNTSDEYAHAYGAGSETRFYYYSTEAPVPRAALNRAVRASMVLQHLSGGPVSMGFNPPHWGPDPSDPFYHSYGQ